MTTRILDLPLLGFGMLVGSNEDWLDSWAYLDASSNPIPLNGISFAFMVRKTAPDAQVYVIATSSGTIDGLPNNGAITAGGTGGNVVALNIPRLTMLRLSPGAYVHEMQATGDGVTRSIATGALTVNQGIVR